MTANQDIRYTLVGRFMDGVNLVGYQVMDTHGNPSSVAKDRAIGLARSNLINNARLVEDRATNKSYLVGVGVKISQLPALNMRTGAAKNISQDHGSMTTLAVIARIMSGTKVIGYVVKDAKGQEYNLSQEKVWQLAREKLVSNVVAQMDKRHKILRSADRNRELRSLPTVAV